MKTVLLAALLCGTLSVAFLLPGSGGFQTTDPPVELGAVNWQRDLQAAKQQSQATGKPILILFQEVPG